MENELKQLGLTDNEIAMYLALLEIGETTVGPLCKKLNMHRQVAYDSLEGLIKKSMVDRIIKGKRYHFRIANPNNIIDDIKRQEIIADNLIPEIEKRLKGQKRGQEIKVYEGPRALREYILEQDQRMPPEFTTVVYSSNTKKYMEIMGRSFKKSDQIRTNKKITTRIVFPEIQREESVLAKRVYSKYRFIPQEHTPPTAFQVFTDSVILISYGVDIFFIQIKNEDFRQTYINYFNLLWNIAKE